MWQNNMDYKIVYPLNKILLLCIYMFTQYTTQLRLLEYSLSEEDLVRRYNSAWVTLGNLLNEA